MVHVYKAPAVSKTDQDDCVFDASAHSVYDLGAVVVTESTGSSLSASETTDIHVTAMPSHQELLATRVVLLPE